MKKLIKGLREFKSSYFSTHQELFEQLSHGQKPRVLFITCSDSRLDPNLITQAQVGELFVIRNAGNIIPPYGATNGGEGATIEYAVQALGIQQIIICGHSHCGAMKGLLKLQSLREDLPLVYDWLKYAEATRRLVLDHYGHYQFEELLEIMIAENVLTQIENLRTYPVIHSKLYQGQLKIYAWIYHIESGEVLAYDPHKHAYVLPQTQLAESETEDTILNPFLNCDVGIRSQADEVTQTQDFTIGASERFPIPHLSPEQRERIYRGSNHSN
ncbi:carbonic anhydrase [Nostoc sp. FACHB-87]|uniref:carbonic anhydrase n=1 Tax=Nostocales TaxID=1161 RepID=UPI0016865FB2|nr:MULTISPECIES: carbonic anhydrase [Nostocales]MBD2298148.1 carbonic anhydrase [Nostoc sp. FACHB-190]MBD2453086.1 carbonic anhydrase [Nostoc sp. FACHB-87]MBD2475134.1 carbonic anhydrase [Anabaena sp. FACHB-83]MBD2489417.1 carbonic anhydrase [Aulosira sp. FACHB-615]